MKPTSIISLIIAVLLVIVGLVTCFIAQNMAGSSGEQLFADRSDGNAVMTETFDPKNLELISIVFSGGRVNIFGNCDEKGSEHYSDSCRIELINFKENYYVLKSTSSQLSFDETGNITSMLKFWENGFSFKGMRYILNLEQIKSFFRPEEEEKDKQINIYLTKAATAALAEDAEAAETTGDGEEQPGVWKLNKILVKATGPAGCDVTIDNVHIDTDYNIVANRSTVKVRKTSTSSFINVGSDSTEVPARRADITVEESSLGYMNLQATNLNFDSAALEMVGELAVTSENGVLRFGMLTPIMNLNTEVRSTGRILVDNEDRSNPYTHVAGSGYPILTVKCGASDVTLLNSMILGNIIPEAEEPAAEETEG